MTPRKPWSFAVGRRGKLDRVTVLENPQRDWVLALRWVVLDAAGKRRPRYESLGRKLRTADGKIIREVERWAKEQADEKQKALIRGDVEAVAGEAPVAAALTIAEAKAEITDPKQGRYPRPTQHRRETEAALDFAVTVWTGQRSWNSIRKGDIRALGRARVDQLRALGHDGLAGAEHTVQRVLTVAQWLRDEEKIDAGACVASKAWKDELRAYWLEVSERHELPRPHQPRFTIEEAFKIIASAESVDPRLAIVLALAPNQRMKQVARIHRSNITLDAAQLRVPTRGKKKGALISLTAWELDRLTTALTTGYLRELEAAYQRGDITDYPIFPAGPLHGGRAHRRGAGTDPSKPKSWRVPESPVARLTVSPTHRASRSASGRYANASIISSDTIRVWFELAQARAKIEPAHGRGPYGVRRAFVDAAKSEKLSRDGLTALGGWADPQMADRIYADADAVGASEEARDFRARLQNKLLPTSRENGANTQQTHNSALDAQDAVGDGVS